MLDKLRSRTGKGKKAAAENASEPEESTESAATDAAPKKGKKLSAIDRIREGKTIGKDASAAAVADDSSGETAASATDPAINPPKRRGRKPAVGAKVAGSDAPSEEPKTGSASTGKPASRAKAPGSKKNPTTLLIGCYPVKGTSAPTQLYELLEDVKQAVCEANKVEHWGFGPYGADARLAQALDAKLTEEGVPAVLAAEPFSAETRAVEQVLLKHYDVVVRGLR